MNFNLTGWRLYAILAIGFLLWPFVWALEKLTHAKSKTVS